MKTEKRKAYSLRLSPELGQHIEESARHGRRSLTAEIVLLVEQGMEWRKEHGNKIPTANIHAD